MKKPNIKFIIFTALFCCFFSLCAFAEDTVVIDNFDTDVTFAKWSGGENVLSLETSGTGYLEAVGGESDSGKLKIIHGSFSEPVLMDNIREITAKVYAEEISGVSGYFVRVRLFARSGDVCESISTIEPGVWSDVRLDISEWKHKEIVTGLEIGVIPEHINADTWTGSFRIDDVVAVSFSESETVTRFLFDNASVTGGELLFAEDGSYFELSLDGESDEAVMEFDVNASSVAFADTLRLNMENYSDATQLALSFADSDSFGKEIYTELRPDGERQIHYIKTGLKSSVKRVSIRVSGNGKLRFNGISLTDGYENKPYIIYGDITSAKLSPDKKQIIITGELPREYVTEFEGCELYLYSLDLNEDAREADYDNMVVIAKHGISTKFTFRIDVGKDIADALLKKYVVKISSTPKVFVDTPTYITVSAGKTASKGASVGYVSDDLSAIGASLSESGIIDVSINRLISAGNSGYMQASAGKYYYFDKSYVDRLDSMISSLYTSGADVIVRLIADGKELDGLYFDSSTDADSYLLNVGSERGYALVRAATEFLVTRYSTPRTGIIDSFIIGKAVNAGRDISSAPNMSFTDTVNSYANAMRLVYITASGCGANVRVYASVSDIYRNDYVVLRNNETDTELFVKALAEYIADEGYFPWGVCAERVSDKGGQRIQASEMAALKGFIGDVSAGMGAAMIVAPISGDGAVEAEAFIKAAELGFVGRYIFSDVDGSCTGIVRAVNSGDRELLESYGINTKAYGELTSSGKIKTKKYTLSSALYNKPEKLMGAYNYYDFNTHTGIGNFTSAYYSKETKVSEERANTPVLTSVIDKHFFEKASGAVLSGVGAALENSISFSMTPVISLDVGVFPTDTAAVSEASVVIRLVSDGRVYDRLARIKLGELNTVYIDFGKTKSESFDFLQVLVKDNDISRFELCVDNITGYSYDYNDNGLAQAMNSSTSGDKGTDNRDLVAVIITVAAILLTLVASLAIIKGAGKKQ